APEHPAGPVEPESPAAGLVRQLGIDAGDLDPHLDPAAPGGDLRADIERFTPLDRCVAERAPVDPLVGDALESIGYATFLRDACRVVEAAKTAEPARCDAIDASSLRDKCRATEAGVAAVPDACPWENAARPGRGRDPVCVAIAARDLTLCAAAA